MYNSKNVINIKYENLTNKYNDIDILPTFNKICLAQNLLKEMNSLKERFEENKNKLINEINQNCFKYYKKAITSKEIYDYFNSNNLEERIEYKLINTPENILNKDLYNSIYNFLFLIRNNFTFLNKIINSVENKYFKDISYIFADLFFEDIATYSFTQDELLIFSFFLFEKLIKEILPNNLNNNNIINYTDFNKNFAFFYLNILSKKIDIRNYFSSFLMELLNKIEDYQDNLSPDLNIILKNFDILINNKDDKKDKIKKSKTLNEAQIFTKRKLKEMIINSNNNIKNIIKKSDSIQNKFQDKGVYYDFEVVDINMSAYPQEKSNKLDPFFEKENLNMQYLCEKLNYYDNIQKKTLVDYALIYYIDKVLGEITNEGEPIEIYSNVLLRNDLKITKINEDEGIHQKIIDIIQTNYDFITSFINILLLKIKESINSLPLSIKYIFKIIEELFKKKFSSEKTNIYNYNLLILKSRLFIEGIIIPILININSYGIWSNKIMSELSKNNLNIIMCILKKAISGDLFLVKDNGFVLYNKYIINIMPTIFEIVLDLNKDCILPKFISDLINNNNTCEYDYFKEKNEENIQFQSICISLKEINIFLNIIERKKDYFVNHNKNNESKNIFSSILKKKNELSSIYKKNLENKYINYYIFTKINYKTEFENKINAIIQDSFEIFFADQKNDIVLKFKKCLSVILTHINYLHNEDFISLINRKEDLAIKKESKLKLFLDKKKELLYENTQFETSLRKVSKNYEVKTQDDLRLIKKKLKKLGNNNFENLEKIDLFFIQRKSTIKNTICDLYEELDFKTIILPKINSKIISELYCTNSQKMKYYQRILFCNSFIQEHFNDLPTKYTQNNFNNIFSEIIQETIFMIKLLQNNILNAFYAKKRNSEKLNIVLNKDFEEIKNIEKYLYVEYIFYKIKLRGNFIINKKIISDEEIIESITLELNKINEKNINIESIQSFIDKIPNFKKNNKNNDILEIQKRLKLDEILSKYFKELKNKIKNEKIMERFSEQELMIIEYELENYILSKLYHKLFPVLDTKEDIFFYEKCSRLKFIRPENVIKDKKMINEKLLEYAINYIKDMENKLTPIDKINNFGKAINILKNSMTFNSGKTDLGLDDTLSFIIYIVIKSKFKNIFSTLDYCTFYINQELSKKQFGNYLTQLKMVINIIKNMKYNDLIDVTEKQFGKDNY